MNLVGALLETDHTGKRVKVVRNSLHLMLARGWDDPAWVVVMQHTPMVASVVYGDFHRND